jgi:YD repeat-containing protein
LATTTLPRITPLLLKRRAAAFDNPDWVYELKYDGFAALLEIDGARAPHAQRPKCAIPHTSATL